MPAIAGTERLREAGVKPWQESQDKVWAVECYDFTDKLAQKVQRKLCSIIGDRLQPAKREFERLSAKIRQS